MKIVTWNVNGIRSFDGKWKEVLENLKADIICVQETKVTRDMLDEPTALIEGYTSYFAFSRKKTGYSGVATYVKPEFMPIKAEEGLSGTLPSAQTHEKIGCLENIEEEFTTDELKALDAEGRCVITIHEISTENGIQQLAVFNVYCPRADPDLPDRLTFKLKFNKLLEMRARNLLKNGYWVLINGDINISHREIDHCDPYEDFSQTPSRKWMDHILFNKVDKDDDDLFQDWKIKSTNDYDDEEEPIFLDTFRHLWPERKEAFTCWNIKSNCRANNFGTRIDYILTCKEMQSFIVQCDIWPEMEGSDHCPVYAELKVTGKPPSKPPQYCTKNFQEFSGQQQKLSAYFSSHNKRKLDEVESESSSGTSTAGIKKKIKQKNISSFFMKQPGIKSNENMLVAQQLHHVETTETMIMMTEEAKIEVEERRLKAASAWKNVMKAPPVAPLCKGHNEPSVLRTVKKKGPNLNRKFWCCARGEGRADDPNARCDFFKWQK